jgi:DNA-binding NarL/FixJ family response regulator
VYDLQAKVAIESVTLELRGAQVVAIAQAAPLLRELSGSAAGQSLKPVSALADQVEALCHDVLKASETAPRASKPLPTTPAQLLDRDWLHRRYVIDGRSEHDIARELGCAQSTVGSWRERHRIPARSAGSGGFPAGQPA